MDQKLILLTMMLFIVPFADALGKNFFVLYELILFFFCFFLWQGYFDCVKKAGKIQCNFYRESVSFSTKS